MIKIPTNTVFAICIATVLIIIPSHAFFLSSGIIKRCVSYKQSRVYENNLSYYRDLIISAPKKLQDRITNKVDNIKQDVLSKKQKLENTITKVDNTVYVINSAKDDLLRNIDDTVIRAEETKLFIVQLPSIALTKVDNSIAEVKSTQQEISSRIKETVDFVVYLPANVTAKVEHIWLQAVEIKDNTVMKVKETVAQAVSIIAAVQFTFSVVQELVQTKNITVVNKLFSAQRST